MADVIVAPAVQQQIDALPRPIATRIARLIERLRDWPRVSGVNPLRGELAGRFRLRTGDYRLQFIVERRPATDEASGKNAVRYVVTVEKAGHRDGFYE